MRQDHSCSLDHLVGAAEHRRRNFEAERLGGRQIYDESNFVGWMHSYILGLEALLEILRARRESARS
jgi:hypothetical protein